MTTLCEHNPHPPTLYVFVPGIRSDAENVLGWWALAETHVDNHGLGVSASYAYEVKAIDRWIHQRKHVRNLKTKIEQRRGHVGRIVLAGHSNGGCVITDMLRDNPDTAVDEIHLIAAAADADYRKNGLNEAVWRGQVKRIVCYCSTNDVALKGATWSKKALGWIGLGFGSLGLTGPAHQSMEAAMLTEIVQRDTFGHSTWFHESHFNQTMNLITGRARL